MRYQCEGKRNKNFVFMADFHSILVAVIMLAGAGVANAQGGFNAPGNILITDQFNNRVIELSPSTGKIVWSFGDGSSVAGPKSIVAPNDAQRVGSFTVIAGTGAPPGTPTQYEAKCQAGCPDNRVIVVDQFGKIVWQYGEAGKAGTGPNQLNTPVQATFLPTKHLLITDQANERVIEVDQQHNIVWQFGETGVTGSDATHLNNPNAAELLDNGDILISDENNNRVIEVNREKKIVWRYSPHDLSKLNGAAFASRLCNGHTLITDSNNNRVIEIDVAGNVVFTFVTNTRAGSLANPLPTRAIRMCDGNSLISDQYNDQVIEVDPSGNIVFSYGQIGVIGRAPGLLNAPYDAKIVGEYVGITPPLVSSFFGKF